MQLSEILLADGLITEGQLTARFDEHQRVGRSLGRVPGGPRCAHRASAGASLSQQIGLPFVDLEEHAVDGLRPGG
jgi:type IV pilus assembly protein PilB